MGWPSPAIMTTVVVSSFLVKMKVACGFWTGGAYQALSTRGKGVGIICNLSAVAKDHAKWPITVPFRVGFCPL